MIKNVKFWDFAVRNHDDFRRADRTTIVAAASDFNDPGPSQVYEIDWTSEEDWIHRLTYALDR